MNKFIILTLAILTSVNIYSQEKEPVFQDVNLSETDSIYLVAIEKYITEIDSFYNKYSPANLTREIYIQPERYLSKLPSKIKGYDIIQISPFNDRKYFKKNKNKLKLVNVSPLTLKNGMFQVTITPYIANKKRKNLNLGLSSWTIIYFDFKNGKLIYTKTENEGI